MKKTITGIEELDREVTRLGCIAALLEWDQETSMPDGAVEERANQVSYIMGLQHQKIIADEWGNLFQQIDSPDGLDTRDAALVRETRKRWLKKTRVPQNLVESMARESSLARSAWARARESGNFSLFSDNLQTVIDLSREYASTIAPDADVYDTLLDEYEPDACGDEIDRIFTPLAAELLDIMGEINSGTAPRIDFLQQEFDVNRQESFGERIRNYLGYDIRRGHMGVSEHPFTTALGPDDVRITTRYSSTDLLSALFSTIHEVGHGLYMQGLGSNLRGTVLADGASLGIHESQSRFWENMAGRSRAFWELWYPDLRKLFSKQLHDVGEDDFYRAVNTVQPSLIRVEADEVTYTFHIIIRFRLERALIRGDLAVTDLPMAWNAAYRDLLGITPPNDAEGCLQDVHWSVGLFGYFPTYALGNLYAAQFADAMERDLGPLAHIIRNDALPSALGWLKKNIHLHGRCVSPGNLCRRVTGDSLNPEYFIHYLKNKYAEVYRLPG